MERGIVKKCKSSKIWERARKGKKKWKQKKEGANPVKSEKGLEKVEINCGDSEKDRANPLGEMAVGRRVGNRVGEVETTSNTPIVSETKIVSQTN